MCACNQMCINCTVVSQARPHKSVNTRARQLLSCLFSSPLLSSSHFSSLLFSCLASASPLLLSRLFSPQQSSLHWLDSSDIPTSDLLPRLVVSSLLTHVPVFLSSTLHCPHRFDSGYLDAHAPPLSASLRSSLCQGHTFRHRHLPLSSAPLSLASTPPPLPPLRHIALVRMAY